MTFPLSLKDWDEAGILEREISLYKKLQSKYNLDFSILTFGDSSEYSYKKIWGNINIIPVYEKLNKPSNYFIQLFHSILIPFYFKKFFVDRDFIQTNQFWGCWLAIISKIIYGKKYILRSGFEFYDFHIKHRKLHKKSRIYFLYTILLKTLSFVAYKFSNKIIITTDASSQFIQKNFKISKLKIQVIPNFIDTDIFKKNESILKNERLLFIGRLSEQKGIELIFKALSNKNIGIDIIGGGKGHLREKYKKIAETLKIDVKFYSNIPNKSLVNFYNSCNIFIIFSNYEGNPKTLLEAMSCECAIICSKVDGIKNIVKNDNCVLVDLNSYDLGIAINKLYNDKDRKTKLGFKARQYILKNNSQEIIVDNFFKVYNEL